MSATADEQGRIRCKECANTLLWLKEGIVHWAARIGPGRKRIIGVPVDSPALNDLFVVCEQCGTRWMPTGKDGPTPAPLVAGVLKPVAA